jgi:hypothetical protein
LADRDVVLIDAEQIHGRRTLMLFDLDQFRLPLPMLVPADRNQPQRSNSEGKSP